MHYKKIGTIVLLILSVILIFQNCGRVVLSDKVNVQSRPGYITAYDIDANDIISAMIDANMNETNEFNDKIEYVADSMVCGNPVGSTQIECRFKSNNKDYKTTSKVAVRVRDYLRKSGIPRECPTCQDSESYAVTNVYCVKNPKYEKDVNCSFKRP